LRVQRYNYVRRRSSLPLLPCACLSVITIFIIVIIGGVLILLPALPGIGAQLMGFRQSGSVESVFNDQAAAPPQISDASPANQVTIQIPGFGAQTINNNPPLYNFTVGTIGGDTQAVSVTFSESGLMELCRQRTTYCSGSNQQFQNARIDLRPNGAVLHADALIPQLGSLRQLIGLVVRLDSSGRRFEFVGVDIGGSLFTSPPEELSQLVNDLQNAVNDILLQLSLQASGSLYTLSRAYIDESTITLLMQ
jgi:hypothetical protein